jgi:hypothetical protein
MSREKFATQVDSDILLAVRTLARTEGRPRPHVMGAYHASHEKFGSLYKKLTE